MSYNTIKLKSAIILLSIFCILFSFSSCQKKQSAKITTKNVVPEEDTSGFCLLTDSIPDVILEIRYFSTYNFVGARVDGYEEPIAIITKQAASALRKVNDEMRSKGYRLKIYDAYRPQAAVNHFMRWAKNFDDTVTKFVFYPDLTKEQVFERGFVATKSSHTRGSTVDLTLIEAESGKEVDMGGVFDYFGTLSHTDYEGVTEKQHNNRIFLQETMKKYGFEPFDDEWWHFTLSNEPYPDTYFTFPLRKDVIYKQ